MSTAAMERYALRGAPTVGPAVALAGLTTLLFVRLFPDVSGKPLHEDEAVAGLISARPLGDVLHTVVLDRGGAPLHFLLAHLALALDSSPDSLRWLSVAFALATVPLCYDLARRLAGRLAGVTAAALAATSQLLTVYGTFGRMYTLFAFTSALAVDLFVRALDRQERRTAVAAATAALLPLSVHPFGLFLFASEAVVAAWIWRGRALRAALPVIGISLLAVPLLLTNLRLTDRYGPEAGRDLPRGYEAVEAALRALGGAAGGYSALFALFAALAVIGAFALNRRHAAFTVFACLTLAAPPVVLAVAAAVGQVSDRLSPRHLVFTLPIWVALVAAGLTRLAAGIPARARIAPLVAVTVAAAFAPSAIPEPRDIPTGDRHAVAAPAAWLRGHLSSGDVLYPYSPVFLASLPEAAAARGYPREEIALARAARLTHDVRAVFVSLPLHEKVTPAAVHALHREGVDAHAFASWLILEQRGPFPDGRSALVAAATMLRKTAPIVTTAAPSTRGYVNQIHGAACAALQRLESSC